MARATGNRQKHESTNPLQVRMIERFHAQVVRLVREVDPGTVLEVGCGEGFVLEALQQAGVTARLRGIDRSEQAIADARARLGPSVDLAVMDASEVADHPGEGGPPDLVLMIEVLEHLDDPGAMVDSLGEVTGRAVLLSVPHEPWFRLANLARLKNVRRLGNDPEHVQHWTARGFRRFVGGRLRVRETVRSFPWTLVLAER